MFTFTMKLQHKLLLLALVPVIIISTMLTYYLAITRIDDVEFLTREKARAIAEQIAADNVNTVFTRNKQQLINNINNYFSFYEDLAEIHIHSLDNNFNYKKISNNQNIANLLSASSDISLSVISDSLEDYNFDEPDITSNVPLIGKVKILLIDRSSKQKNEIIQTSILILLSMLGLTTLLVFPMSKKLTTPIKNLVVAFDSLAKGNFNTRVKEEARDELLNLQRGFNRMSTALSRQHENLHEQVEQVNEDLNTTLQALEIQNVELDIARKQAIELSRVKSEFLANMSHEIRTPMNGIVGFTSLLKQTQLNQLQQQYLQTIDHSAKSLLLILNDILDFSKLEAGKIEIHNHLFSIEDFTAEAINLFTPLAFEKQLNLIPIIYNDVPESVIGDRLRLLQVISNLLSNAIKFTDQGDIVFRVMLEDLAENNCKLGFSVSDSGIGIDKDKQKVLFQPFRQVNTDLSRGYGGTGLGLSISKSLTEMMGGEIKLESKTGKGSSFTVTVPFSVPQEPEQIDKAGRMPQFAGRDLLLLDNHPLFRASLSNMLTQLGFRVTAEGNTDPSRLDKQKLKANDVIIMSLHANETPSLSKLDSQVIENWSTPCLVLLSASEQQQIDNHSQRLGCTVLKSPTFSKQIAPCLQQLLNTDSLTEKLPENNQAALSGKLHNKRILVVDDNEINQQLLSIILSDSGAIITTADNGLEAINLFGEMEFDLVFMDIHMPELNGIDTTAKLRLSDHDIPIIAITADVAFKESESSALYGFNGVLIKPFDAEALYRVINTVMDLSPVVASSTHEYKKHQNLHEELPIRDLNQALRITGGKKTVADKLLNQLVEQLPDYLAQIRQECNNKDWEQLWQILHKLHGATLVCGIPAFNKVINNMQKHVRNAEYLSLDKELEKLEKEAKRLAEFTARIPQKGKAS